MTGRRREGEGLVGVCAFPPFSSCLPNRANRSGETRPPKREPGKSPLAASHQNCTAGRHSYRSFACASDAKSAAVSDYIKT